VKEWLSGRPEANANRRNHKSAAASAATSADVVTAIATAVKTAMATTSAPAQPLPALPLPPLPGVPIFTVYHSVDALLKAADASSMLALCKKHDMSPRDFVINTEEFLVKELGLPVLPVRRVLATCKQYSA
jgi:hypothetical protein